MRAIVSGASRGLGRAFCFELLKHNYDLAIVARGLTELQELKEELLHLNKGVEILVLSADLSKSFEASNAAQSVLNQWASVDLIVNNAGLYEESMLHEDSLLDKMLSTNLKSAYNLTTPFIDSFRERKSGAIINICSVLSENARNGAADYSISKHALYGFGKALSVELKPFEVKVLNVLPGSINSSSWDGINAPVSEFIQPEDLAELCVSSIHTSKGTYVDELRVSALNPNY